MSEQINLEKILTSASWNSYNFHQFRGYSLGYIPPYWYENLALCPASVMSDSWSSQQEQMEEKVLLLGERTQKYLDYLLSAENFLLSLSYPHQAPHQTLTSCKQFITP